MKPIILRRAFSRWCAPKLGPSHWVVLIFVFWTMCPKGALSNVSKNHDDSRFEKLVQTQHYFDFALYLEWIDSASGEELLSALSTKILWLKLASANRPIVDYLVNRLLSPLENNSQDQQVSNDNAEKFATKLLESISVSLSKHNYDLSKNRVLPDLIKELAGLQPGAVLDWLDSEDRLKHHIHMINPTFSALAETMPEETLSLALTLGGGSPRAMAVVYTLQTVSKTEPKAAADAFLEHLSIDDQVMFLDTFVDGIIETHPEAAMAVISRMPDSVDPRAYHMTEARVRSQISIPDALVWANSKPWGNLPPDAHPPVLAEWAMQDIEAMLEFAEAKILAGDIDFAQQVVFGVLQMRQHDLDARSRTREWLTQFNLPDSMMTELQQSLEPY